MKQTTMKWTILALALVLAVAGNAYGDRPMRFKANLEGFNAGGMPIPTNATGNARVEVIDDGTALEFRVIVAGIDNLLMAHIHIAPAPVALTDPAGPIAYWFTGGPPPAAPDGSSGDNLTERVNGRLAQGFIITDGDVEDWDVNSMNPDPQSGTVAGLINAIKKGRASVVVHTDDLNPDTPTGVAGDSRAGELRGTLQ
jgi:hypothetical protein